MAQAQKIPVWATAVHAVVIVLSAVVMLVPATRGTPVRAALMVAVVVMGVRLFIRMKRAGVLRMTLSEAAATAPKVSTYASTLESAAVWLSAFAVVISGLQ